jgi:hypothetical protein
VERVGSDGCPEAAANGRFSAAVWQGTVHPGLHKRHDTATQRATTFMLFLVIANDCSSRALECPLVSLGDFPESGQTHLAYNGGRLPPIAVAECGDRLDDRSTAARANAQ